MDARHVLFFIHLESRRVSLAGMTRYPDEGWVEQMARQLGKQSPRAQHKLCQFIRELMP